VARTFADVPPGAALLYENAVGAIAVAVNRGDAAARLGVGPGDELVLRPAETP
jgi:S-adenosylmethionine hydrolase